MTEYKREKPKKYQCDPRGLDSEIAIRHLMTTENHLAEALELLSELHSGHRYTEHEVFKIEHHIRLAWDKSK